MGIIYSNKMSVLSSKRKASGTLVLGHRGVRGLAPEHTLAGFELAIEMGLDGVEMDVMLCGSGEPVVFHDYRLDVLCGAWGWVENTPLSELRKLDIGAMFHPRYRGEKMPTLEEVLDLLKDKMLINIELKGEDADDDGLEPQVAHLARKMGLIDNVIASSFNPMRIARVKEYAPELATGLLIQNDFAGWLRRFWFAPIRGADAIHPEIGMVTKPLVEKWHRNDKTVIAWPANTEGDMKMLIEAGVDGIISDRPDRLMRLLGRDHDGREN